MTSIALGEHSKLTVPPSERQDIRKFYRDVLGFAQVRDVFASGRPVIGENSATAKLYAQTLPRDVWADAWEFATELVRLRQV